MPDTLSVVIPVRNFDGGLKAARRLPKGASEILLVTGPGVAGAKNAGAEAAKGSLLLFTDDDSELRGDLSWFLSRPPSECWWRGRMVDGTGGRAAPNCRQLNTAGSLGLPLGSNGPFQLVRRYAFYSVGAFRPDEVFEDIGLSRRLAQGGFRLHPSPLSIVVHRPFASFSEVARRRSAEAMHGISGPFELKRLEPIGPEG
jgi:hypothetical protein